MKNIIENSLITNVFDFYSHIKKVCINTAILESLGDIDAETARYSFLGVIAKEELCEQDGEFLLTKFDEKKVETIDNWLALLDDWCGPIGINDTVFQTGAIGYIGYEMYKYLEKITVVGNVKSPVSQVRLVKYSLILIYDRVENKSFWVADDETYLNQGKLYESEYFNHVEYQNSDDNFFMLGDIESDFTQKQYMDSISKCIQYIHQGDMLQSNITMRFHGKYVGNPFKVYSRMRETTPNPYFAYFDFEEKMISTSPESFIRMSKGVIQSRPIKGTVRCVINGVDQADFLQKSRKNCAENTMIADLIRNDIGRVCRIGSVRVPALCKIKKCNNLYHLETVVEGDLKENIMMSEILRGNFPGGSITGAPKIRSMEIIDELEFTERGPYTGMVGFWGNSGYVNTSIGIRIVYFDRESFYIHAGGGIVAKSDPVDEYNELMLKIEKMISSMNEFNVLKLLRNEIDKLNIEIIRKLSERTELIRKVSSVKFKYGIPANQPDRVRSILDRMKKINDTENLGLDEEFIEKLFTLIIDESVRIEELGGRQ